MGRTTPWSELLSYQYLSTRLNLSLMSELSTMDLGGHWISLFVPLRMCLHLLIRFLSFRCCLFNWLIEGRWLFGLPEPWLWPSNFITRKHAFKNHTFVPTLAAMHTKIGMLQRCMVPAWMTRKFSKLSFVFLSRKLSVIKITCCSSRGLGFGFQYPPGVS